jgi:hypothetical protein
MRSTQKQLVQDHMVRTMRKPGQEAEFLKHTYEVTEWLFDPLPPTSPVRRVPVRREWPSPQAGRALRVRWPMSGAGTLVAGAARRGSARASPDRSAGREVDVRRREQRSWEQVPGARLCARAGTTLFPPSPPPGPPASGYLICMLPGLACVRARAPGATGRSVGRGGREGAQPLGGGGAGVWEVAERELDPAPRHGSRGPLPPFPAASARGEQRGCPGSQGPDTLATNAPAYQAPSCAQ